MAHIKAHTPYVKTPKLSAPRKGIKPQTEKEYQAVRAQIFAEALLRATDPDIQRSIRGAPGPGISGRFLDAPNLGTLARGEFGDVSPLWAGIEALGFAPGALLTKPLRAIGRIGEASRKTERVYRGTRKEQVGERVEILQKEVGGKPFFYQKKLPSETKEVPAAVTYPGFTSRIGRITQEGWENIKKPGTRQFNQAEQYKTKILGSIEEAGENWLPATQQLKADTKAWIDGWKTLLREPTAR